MAKNIILKTKLEGAEKTKRGLKSVDGGLKSLGKSALKVGGAFFAASGIIRGFSSVIRLAGEQEQAEKKLATALGKTSSTLLDYASSLQKVTTFGDEATIEAMAMMAAFTKDEEALKKLTSATLDYAAATGTDLNAAAQLVGRTFGTSMNAMSRYGVAVEGAAGSTQRLESLTGNLANMFGGQAQAQAETMAGSLKQMQNALGDTAETVGSLLSPVIINIAGFLNTAAKSAQEFFARATETSLETSIRELQSLGVNTLNLELAFSKAEAAKAKYQAVGLRDEEEISKNLNDNAQLLVGYMTERGQLQAKLLEQGISEEDLLQQIAGARLAISGASSGRMADQKVMAMQTKKEAEAKLAEIELMNQLIANTRTQNELDQADLEIIQKKEAAEAAVLALQQAITQNKENQAAIPENPVTGPKALSDLDKFMLKQLEQFDLMEKEKGHIEAFIKLHEKEAEALGLIKEKKASQLEIDLKSAALTGQSAIQSMKSVVRAEAMKIAVKQITSIFSNPAYPYPLNLILAAGAGGVTAALIDKVLSAIPNKFAAGADFVTAGPTPMLVGEAGPERVQVTPMGQPASSSMTINISGGVVDDDYVRNTLIPALNKATGMGARINA